jgi:23S rRNA (adenine2503-C2)-methyltransferase
LSEAKLDLLSLTEEELKDWMKESGQQSFRGTQIFEWVQKGNKNIEEMSNLSKDLREFLMKNGKVTDLTIDKTQHSKLDETVKFLFQLEDQHKIESVLMKYKHGYTLCISTQAGCAMGCGFCASTKGGLQRNLTAGEIIDQVHQVQRVKGVRISNVVLMGIGEPLDNFQEVKKFLWNIHNPKGLNISNRNLTLSTCGLVPEIYQLKELNLPINLAISLHAPDDTLRQQIMPIARKYSIEELLKACRDYIKKTNRRITFEYALVKDFNDQREHAKKLAKILKGMLCHVNIIPVNPIDQGNFEKPFDKTVQAFEAVLKENRIPVTVRRELGQDIDAACGQLRNRN